MSPKLSPPKLADIAAEQGRSDGPALPPVAPRCEAPAQQGLPDPLVVHARRDRAVFFIILLLTGVYLTLFFDPSMGEVVYTASINRSRRRDVAGVRVRAEHQLRGARRPVRPADPPLGGTDVLRGDHGPHGPDLLHRRVPQAARSELGDRLALADPGDVRGLLRLLAARRPAVGDRAARRIVVDHHWESRDRHLVALGAVRR